MRKSVWLVAVLMGLALGCRTVPPRVEILGELDSLRDPKLFVVVKRSRERYPSAGW